MSKRCVWVVEGRRKNRPRELWLPMVAKRMRHLAVGLIQNYRDDYPYNEFRVTKYVPEKL